MRDLAIALAMGVILVSLVTASLALPRLLRRLRFPLDCDAEAEETNAREVAGAAAVDAIEKLKDELRTEDADPELCGEAADRALERYSRGRLVHAGSNEERARNRDLHDLERRLRLAGLKAERKALFRLRRRHEIEDVMLRRLLREVDLLETRFGGE